MTTIATFDHSNGAYPEAHLVKGEKGGLYGMTGRGGQYDRGTVFRVTTSGTLTTLASIAPGDNIYSGSPLVFDGQGLLFGTTSTGGRSGGGGVFAISIYGKNLAPEMNPPVLIGEHVLISLRAVPDRQHRVLRAINLSGPWETIGSIVTASDGRGEVYDMSPVMGSRYYKAVSP